MNVYDSNLSKLYKITETLYTNVCLKDNNNTNFDKIWNTIKNIYDVLFKTEKNNILNFELLCQINRLLYIELLIENNDEDSKNYIFIYEKVYDYIICILYNQKNPYRIKWNILIKNLNNISIKNETSCKNIQNDIIIIKNIMKIYKFNEFLQRLCLKCVSQIASNHCKLLCDIGIIKDIEMSLFRDIYNKWDDIQIQIYHILTNITRNEDGCEFIGLNTIKQIKKIVFRNTKSNEVLESIFICLSNLCLMNSYKKCIGKHKFLLIIKNIFSKNIKNDKLVSSIIQILINLCSDIELDEFSEQICIIEFTELLIKYIYNYLLRQIPYNETIIINCCKFLISISNSISFKHHFLSGGGIELLYFLKNMDNMNIIFRNTLFIYINEILDSLQIDSELVFEENYSSLHIAAQNGDVKTVYKILKNTNININTVNRQGNTALHIAMYYKRKHIIRYLTTCGININIKNLNNKTVFNISQNKILNKDIKNFNKASEKIKSEIIDNLSIIFNTNNDIPNLIFKYYDIYTNIYIHHSKRYH